MVAEPQAWLAAAAVAAAPGVWQAVAAVPEVWQAVAAVPEVWHGLGGCPAVAWQRLGVWISLRAVMPALRRSVRIDCGVPRVEPMNDKSSDAEGIEGCRRQRIAQRG